MATTKPRMNPKYATLHKAWKKDADKIAKQMQALAPLLFKQVKTPQGVGLMIGLVYDCPYNGLYIEPTRGEGIEVQVWYSTEKSQGGYVAYRFDAKTIMELNAEAIKAAQV